MNNNKHNKQIEAFSFISITLFSFYELKLDRFVFTYKCINLCLM